MDTRRGCLAFIAGIPQQCNSAGCVTEFDTVHNNDNNQPRVRRYLIYGIVIIVIIIIIIIIIIIYYYNHYIITIEALYRYVHWFHSACRR